MFIKRDMLLIKNTEYRIPSCQTKREKLPSQLRKITDIANIMEGTYKTRDQ